MWMLQTGIRACNLSPHPNTSGSVLFKLSKSKELRLLLFQVLHSITTSWRDMKPNTISILSRYDLSEGPGLPASLKHPSRTPCNSQENKQMVKDLSEQQTPLGFDSHPFAIALHRGMCKCTNKSSFAPAVSTRWRRAKTTGKKDQK